MENSTRDILKMSNHDNSSFPCYSRKFRHNLMSAIEEYSHNCDIYTTCETFTDDDPVILIPRDPLNQSLTVLGCCSVPEIVEVISEVKDVSREDIYLTDESYDHFNNSDSKIIHYGIKSWVSLIPINVIDVSPETVRSSDISSIRNHLSKKLDVPSSFFKFFTDTDKYHEISDTDENHHMDSIYYSMEPIDSDPSIETLSQGQFLQVYKCTDLRYPKMLMIIKFGFNRSELQNIGYEQFIHKLLGDRSRIFGFRKLIKTDDAFYVSLEYVAGESLGSLVTNQGELPEHNISKNAEQITEGLTYLPRQMIIHRDIKEDNILLSNDENNELCGFDPFTKHVQSTVGVPHCMPSDVIFGEPCECPVDIRSFGATMVEMVTGQIPSHDYDKYIKTICYIGTNKRSDHSYPSSGSENEDLEYDPSNLHIIKDHFNAHELIDDISIKESELPQQIVLSNNNTEIIRQQIFYKINRFISCIPIWNEGEPCNVAFHTCNSSIRNHLSNQLGIPALFFQFFKDRDKHEKIENFDTIVLNNILFACVYYSVEPIVDNYVPLKSLGSGAFGKVYKCIDVRSNKILAIKHFKIPVEKAKNTKNESFKNEIKIVKLLVGHLRIIGFVDSIKANGDDYIVMEYMSGGSIGSLVSDKGALPEVKIVKYAKQIAEGLKYLHNQMIIHRDIKGDNILLDDNDNVKLGDLGLAKDLRKIENFDILKVAVQSAVGTPHWMAPEIILGEAYGFSVDIWSFGATMVEMVTGLKPFHDYDNYFKVIYDIGQSKRIDYSYPASGSESMREFIGLCLKSNQNERPTIDELLLHSFFVIPS